MTFLIGSVYDTHYSCSLGHNMPVHEADVDNRTWTCRTCQQSLRIEMRDPAGNTYHVERHRADELGLLDFIVYQVPGGLAVGQVMKSEPRTGKGHKWYLAVLQFGGHPVEPERYVNRLVSQ